GQVVRGVAGRRSEYRPVVSRLTASCEPVAVARAFEAALGLRELYLADLDAIAGAEPAWPVLEALCGAGFGLWVDAGVRCASRAVELMRAGVQRVGVGLEALAGPGELAAAVAGCGERVVLSLDLREGQAMGDLTGWGTTEPAVIAGQAVALGVRR